MRARRCVAHLLTCKVGVWVRLASSYGRYVTRLWAPGTIFSLLSSALSSLLLARCRPGWWASLWCSMSATSRRKTNSWTRTRKRKTLSRVEARVSGVTMETGIWKRHILFERFIHPLHAMDSYSASCQLPGLSVKSNHTPVTLSLFNRLNTEGEGFNRDEACHSSDLKCALRWAQTHSGCHSLGPQLFCLSDHVRRLITCASWFLFRSNLTGMRS